MNLSRCLVGVLCVAGLATSAWAEDVVTLKPRSDVVVKMLVDVPADAKAVALLFPGGHGKVNIEDDGTFAGLKGNFLVRSRGLFVANGVGIAVFDAPSDRKDKDGLSYSYRMGEQHAGDIKAAIAHLKGMFPNLPIWLVGTSRGSTSAANAGVTIKDGGADGLVLTSAVGVQSKHGGNLLDFKLSEIKTPVLVVHHRGDGCRVTPFSGAEDIKKALTGAKISELLAFEGGGSEAEPCQGKSHHGFFGIEKQVVDAIANWIGGH